MKIVGMAKVNGGTTPAFTNREGFGSSLTRSGAGVVKLQLDEKYAADEITVHATAAETGASAVASGTAVTLASATEVTVEMIGEGGTLVDVDFNVTVFAFTP